MIYTSYYNNIDRIKTLLIPDAVFISVSGLTPIDNILKYKQLMPQYKWWKDWHDKFSNNINSDESIKCYTTQYYNNILNNLNPFVVYNELQSFGKDVILLCFEEYGFCHRHLIRKWFNDNNLKCFEI